MGCGHTLIIRVTLVLSLIKHMQTTRDQMPHCIRSSVDQNTTMSYLGYPDNEYRKLLLFILIISYSLLFNRACTCDVEEHPGPTNSQGRGAPEIDALEAQKNKLGDGGKVSQSAQFAPFTHDYLYNNDSTDYFEVYNTDVTQPNTYRGSAVQQAVSGLTDLKADIYNGTGAKFYTFGFEYWTDASNPDEGFITWVANGEKSMRMGAGAVTEDPLPDGSGVGRRLIPEEPMSIVLNLAISGK